jgi:hypothetical protein
VTISAADLGTISERCGVSVSVDGDQGSAGSLHFSGLTTPEAWWQPDLDDILPSRPRGDYRERTVNLLVRDAIPTPANHEESELFAPPGPESMGGAFYHDPLIADPSLREHFGDILRDLYVIETTSGKTSFLFPFHSDLPGNYQFAGRYKMFNGLILAFLAMPGNNGSKFNTQLLDAFYKLFNDEQELSLLDRQALRIARDYAVKTGGEAPERMATAAALTSSFTNDLPLDPLLPEAHELVQRDLATAIQMHSLGRKDRVTAVLTVFYLHLALYFWRIGYALEEQATAFAEYLAGENGALDEVVRASDSMLRGSPFRGKILFRVSSTLPRTVRLGDPCAVSFREVNTRRLTLLPVNISLLATTRRLLAGSGVKSTFGDAATVLAADETLRRSFDGACRLAAYAVSERLDEIQAKDVRAIASGYEESGFQALRAALLKTWRSELRRSTTDITAALMRRGGKGLAATRGRVQYFELGQDLLLLLTKLVTADGGAVRYEEFLERLTLYGLAPQDGDEEDVLADVLHSLQLLEKYSDTGEAMYVKHFL